MWIKYRTFYPKRASAKLRSVAGESSPELGTGSMNKLMIPRLEVPEITGQSQSNVDRAVACGDLDTTMVGRKRFTTPAAIQKWLDFLASESSAGHPVCYMASDPDKRRTPERANADRARPRRRASS